jgi:hypothetical protein
MESPMGVSSVMMAETTIHVTVVTELPALPFPSKGAAMDTCVARKRVMMEIPPRGMDATALVHLNAETVPSTLERIATTATQTQEMGVTPRANPSHAVMALWK